MASACVNSVGIASENFLDCPPVKCPSYGWLNPGFSLSREFGDADVPGAASGEPPEKSSVGSSNADLEKLGDSDPETSGLDFIDFEFRLVDPVAMLTADELFSDGKLVPLHLSALRQSMISRPASSGTGSEEAPETRRRNEMSSTDPYLFSPKAPRCTARWKDILGLKKLYQSKQEPHKTATSSSPNKAARGLYKHFLHRAPRSGLTASIDSSLSLPLLKEPDTNDSSLSLSSRLSLSSSSSGHEHDDLPRLSLESDKPTTINPRTNTTQHAASNLSKVRVPVKHRSTENQTASLRFGRSPMRLNPESTAPSRGVSVDSPRMNSYGKIVFHGLERSSSSPSTFNGGPHRPYNKSSRGMERSYSANVRVTPVLNVPVCTLRGSSKSGVFGLFSSSQQRKDSGYTVGGNRIHQQHHNKNRTDRT